MEKQDTLRNVLIAAGVFVLAMTLAPYLMPARPPVSASDESPATPGATPTTLPGGRTDGTGQAAADAIYTAAGADETTELEMGAKAPASAEGETPAPPPYRLRAILSNVGASIQSVLLSDHAEHVRKPQRYQLLSPASLPDGTVERSFAIEKINIDGHDVVLEDVRWHAGLVQELAEFPGEFARGGGQQAEFTLEILKDDQPELRLRRVFLLPAQPIEAGRHDLWSGLSVESLSAHPHRVVVTYRGPVGVPGANGQYGGQHIDFGIRNEAGQTVGSRKAPAEVAKSAGYRQTLYRLAPETSRERFAWAAIDNTYFSATAAPIDPAGRGPAAYVAEVAAVDLDANPETASDVTLSFVTVAQELAAGAKLEFQSELYLGEKDRTAFKTLDPYKDRNYYFQIAAGLSWCTFNWLVEIMISLLNALYFVVRDFGVAIIILVLIVRALLHPLTKKGQVNMVRMQQRMAEFAPKVEEIKKKYGNDKVKLQQETMKLYREHGINPAGQMLTCMPMMLQLPVWAALFFSLSNNILMRHEPLHFTWIHDLTAQDALIPFSSPFHIPILGWQLESFNLLPLLVAVFMYVQQKTMPKPEPSPNMTEQQRAQQDMMQKMMVITPIMMILFFYKMPAGLNLYIMFSSLFGWLEQKHIRAHIKEREKAGTLHRPRGGPPAENHPINGKARKPGWLAGWIDRVQKAAEDAQKAQRTQGRGKPKGKR